MVELLIIAVWVVTLAMIVYLAVTEITKIVSLEDGPRRDNRRGIPTALKPMYFDVTKIERAAMVRERHGRVAH